MIYTYKEYVPVRILICVPMYSKSAATITGLLSSAEALFLKKNYADVTMEDIAKAAGVTKGAAYHHFTNKETLYFAMMQSALKEKQVLFQTEAESPGTCRERLSRLTAIFLELPREKRDIIKLVRRDINIFKDPVRSQLVRAYQSALPEQIETIIQDGIRDGELAQADPRLLSWMYAAIVEVILTPYAERVFENQKEMLDFVIRLFFNGAGAT
jgi:TetR/AcrR family transcriptional regulator